MEPIEVEVGPHTYRISKMDAFSQLHVARKMAPLLAGLKSLTDLSLDEAFLPIAKALSEMSDQDVEYVLTKCLAVCARKMPAGMNGYQPVWNSHAKRPQYEDLDLPVMLQLSARVIQENLGSFLGAAGPIIAAQQATKAAQSS